MAEVIDTTFHKAQDVGCERTDGEYSKLRKLVQEERVDVCFPEEAEVGFNSNRGTNELFGGRHLLSRQRGLGSLY